MSKRINIYEEASRCLLCQDAPCTKACQTGDPARAIRAIRFDNHKPALRWVKDCSDADLERAEQACIHYNWPIRIKEMLRSVHPDDVDDSHYPDLTIDFCGIRCENPFFLASSAVCRCVPTTRWWRMLSMPAGPVCSIRPSACRRLGRCRRVSTLCTTMPPTATSYSNT